jgi:hypothetical protein
MRKFIWPDLHIYMIVFFQSSQDKVTLNRREGSRQWEWTRKCSNRCALLVFWTVGTRSSILSVAELLLSLAIILKRKSVLLCGFPTLSSTAAKHFRVCRRPQIELINCFFAAFLALYSAFALVKWASFFLLETAWACHSTVWGTCLSYLYDSRACHTCMIRAPVILAWCTWLHYYLKLQTPFILLYSSRAYDYFVACSLFSARAVTLFYSARAIILLYSARARHSILQRTCLSYTCLFFSSHVFGVSAHIISSWVKLFFCSFFFYVMIHGLFFNIIIIIIIIVIILLLLL